MKFCETCQNTGSTTPDGDLDCTAPGCEAATQRAEFNTWLLQMGWPEGRVKEWAIYRHGLRTADESAALQMEDLERVLKAGFINANVDLDRLIEAKDAAEKQAFNLSNAFGLQAIRINALVEEAAAAIPAPSATVDTPEFESLFDHPTGTIYSTIVAYVDAWQCAVTEQAVAQALEGQAARVLHLTHERDLALRANRAQEQAAQQGDGGLPPLPRRTVIYPDSDERCYVLAFTDEQMRTYALATRQSAPASAAAPQGVFPSRDLSKPAEQQGIFEKFRVGRTDGSDAPGGKHHGCRYFVLDLDHDQHAPAGMRGYAADCRDTHPVLADEIEAEFAHPPADAAPVDAKLADLSSLKRFAVHIDWPGRCTEEVRAVKGPYVYFKDVAALLAAAQPSPAQGDALSQQAAAVTPREMAIAQAIRQECSRCYRSSGAAFSVALGNIDLAAAIRALNKTGAV